MFLCAGGGKWFPLFRVFAVTKNFCFNFFCVCFKIVEGTSVTWKGKDFIRTERLPDYAWRRQSWAELAASWRKRRTNKPAGIRWLWRSRWMDCKHYFVPLCVRRRASPLWLWFAVSEQEVVTMARNDFCRLSLSPFIRRGRGAALNVSLPT